MSKVLPLYSLTKLLSKSWHHVVVVDVDVVVVDVHDNVVVVVDVVVVVVLFSFLKIISYL